MSEQAWTVEVGTGDQVRRYLVGANTREQAVGTVLRLVGVDARIVRATRADPLPANSPSVKSGQAVLI